MSLRKKPPITEKRITASQANGRRSRGPATPEGRGRIRDANTRHGFYSEAEGVALRILGEDPEEVELCEALRVENLRECVKGPSPYERAAEIACSPPNALVMRRATAGKSGGSPTRC